MSSRGIKWLSDLRAGNVPIKSEIEFAANVDKIKNAQSGLSSVDDAIKALPFSQVGDEIHVNGARFRDMEAKFRRGELKSAFEDAGIVSTVPKADESALRTMIGREAPDIDIAILDDRIKTAKSFHSDLDVKSTSGADLESKLSPRAKEKAKSMMSTIVKVVGVGTVAAGIFTAVLLTDNVFDDIHNIANSKNGCFLVNKNTTTQACKIMSKSCKATSSPSTTQTCTSEQNESLQYNIYLLVKHIAVTNDTTAIDELKTKGCIWETGDTFDVVLSKDENIPILVAYYNENYPTFTSVPFIACDLYDTDFSGCISCDPTQPTRSVNYTSTESLDGSFVYKCINDTSAIEGLVDLATGLGIDIFTASGDSISGSFQGNFLLVVIIILTLVTAIAIILKITQKKKDNKIVVGQLDSTTNQQPPSSYQSTIIPTGGDSKRI